jgi:hypothetical protein
MSERESREAEFRRKWWKRLAAGFSLLGSSLVAVRVAFDVPTEAIARVGAAGLAAIGVLYGGRLYVHLVIGYWNWEPEFAPDPSWTGRERKRLNTFVVSEAAIAAGLLGAGGYFFFQPQNVVQLLLSLGFAVVMTKAAFGIRDLLLKDGAPPRGSERVERCRVVQWVHYRAFQVHDAAPFFLEAYDACFKKTRPLQLSGFAVVLLLAVSAITAAHTAAGLPDVAHYISRRAPHGGRHPADDARRWGDAVVAVKTVRDSASATAIADGGPIADEPPIPPRALGYEDLCGSAITPGDGAPPALRLQLKLTWAAYGGQIAGCAGRAHLVHGSSVAYYVLGHLDGELVSVAVASSTYPAAVLLDSPARLAKRLAEGGTLRGASPRTAISRGDFHVLYTTAGGWVTIRQGESDDERYVTLPPSLAGLWLRFGALFEPSWPELAADTTGVGKYFKFYSVRDPGTVVATGFCSTPRRCELRSGDVLWHSWDPGLALTVTADRVLESGPR